MSAGIKTQARSQIFNVPNQLTISRFVLSLVLFGLMARKQFLASFVVFLLAATTDWLDGFLARKYGLVTMLGRILDPFVDKIIMCGTFICLVAEPQSQVASWMTVVIVGRELLVTALRSFLEQRGSDFSASFSGKIKMVLQCAAAAMSLFYLYLAQSSTPATWWPRLLLVTMWATVLITVYSGAEYVRRAIGLLRD